LRKMNIVLLAGLFAAALLWQTCEGSMIPEHPQTAFCKADFGTFLFRYLSFKTS